MHIIKTDDGYRVVSRLGKNCGKIYATKDGAKYRRDQIKYFTKKAYLKRKEKRLQNKLARELKEINKTVKIT